MLARVGAVALVGLEARPVRVECTLGGGLPGMRLVGLPDTSVRESADRVKSAVQRARLNWPQERVVVNLAPAALPKSGAGFDLAVALAVLGASGQVPAAELAGTWALGELGLDGAVRPVPGTIAVAAAARELGAGRLVVPMRSAVEAALADGLEVVGVDDLAEAVGILDGSLRVRPVPEAARPTESPAPDLADVRGQPVARRALEIAAAGGHHLLLAGPPGCGKSMLARRLPGLLPPLTVEQALEVATVHSVAGVRAPDASLSLTPPFRDPHHTISRAGLVGGGTGVGRPGEISLAHHGVLFIDELLELPRWVLDALRQPLERGEVTLVRSRAAVRFPARVLLVAATNPCPCGHLGDPRRACRCRPDQVDRYRARLSGPLLDRIDLQVEMRPVAAEDLLATASGEPTGAVAARVRAAREVALARSGRLVRETPIGEVRATLRPAALRALRDAVDVLALSARAFDRCTRVARTVADLAGCESVDPDHVDEAVAYRLPSVTAAA